MVVLLSQYSQVLYSFSFLLFLLLFCLFFADFILLLFLFLFLSISIPFFSFSILTMLSLKAVILSFFVILSGLMMVLLIGKCLLQLIYLALAPIFSLFYYLSCLQYYNYLESHTITLYKSAHDLRYLYS